MRKIIILLSCISISSYGFAQQDMPTTQYLSNKLSFNPAYAGATEDMNVVGLYRNQWNGIQGQPIQYITNFSTPIFGTKSSIGFNFNLDKIGPVSLYNFFGNYSYKIPFAENKSLRIGLRGGYTHGVVNQAALEGFYAGDPSFTESNVFFNKPVFGSGLYYESEKLAIGFSVPNVIVSSLDFSADKNIFKNVFNMYLGGEYVFHLTDKLALKPAIYGRYNANSPISVDMNVYAIINKFLWIGAGRRTSNTYMANVQWVLNEILFPNMKNELKIGYAYDFSNSTYNSTTNGTHELMIGYNFNRKKDMDKIQSVSPRYF